MIAICRYDDESDVKVNSFLNLNYNQRIMFIQVKKINKIE